MITLGIKKAQEKNNSERDNLTEVEAMLRPGRKVETQWTEAKGVFLVLSDGKIVVMEDQMTDKYHFYSNDPQIETLLNRTDFQQYAYKTDSSGEYEGRDDYQMTHSRLLEYLDFAFSRILNRPMRTAEVEGMINISSRVWEFPEINLAGFWQDKRTVKSNWRSIVWALHKLGIDEKECIYTLNAKIKRQYSYEDIMDIHSKEDKANPNELKLMKLIHLNPEIKRNMLNVGSNKLQDYADKLKIPLAQLKQLLGSMDENTK